MESIITSISTFIITVLCFYLISKGKENGKLSSMGQPVLRLHSFFKYFGIILIVFAIGINMIPILFPEENDSLFVLISMVGLPLFFGLSGFYFIMEHKNHYITHSEQMIQCSNFKGNIKTIKWSDIIKVSFNSIAGKVEIKDKLGNKIYINQFIKGLDNFLSVMESKTDFNLEKLKRQVNTYSFK